MRPTGSAIGRDSFAARFGGRSCETAHRWIVGERAEKPSLSDEYCDGGEIMRHPVSLFRDLLLVAGLLLFLPISLAHAASAENRVALVIGQSAYRAVPALPNAENDGKRMAELLTNAGFDVTAARSVAERHAPDHQRLRGQSGRERTRHHRAGVLCWPWLADRWRELPGADRCRSETRSRHSATGRPAQRSPEHVRGAANPDAHHHARCLPQ